MYLEITETKNISISEDEFPDTMVRNSARKNEQSKFRLAITK